ncbi:hypothetical protein MRX96_042271 [Rhipicephalus microplus]
MEAFRPASHVERASAAARSRRALVRGAHCERETKCRRRPILRSRCPCPPSASRPCRAVAAAAREGLPPRCSRHHAPLFPFARPDNNPLFAVFFVFALSPWVTPVLCVLALRCLGPESRRAHERIGLQKRRGGTHGRVRCPRAAHYRRLTVWCSIQRQETRQRESTTATTGSRRASMVIL